MTGIEISFAQLRCRIRRQPAGRHEGHRFIDAIGQLSVFFRLLAGRHEFEVPAMDLLKIGVPALSKRPQQIQRRCRLVVHLYHAFGIRNAAGFGKRHVIDHVPPIARQSHPVLFLHV